MTDQSNTQAADKLAWMDAVTPQRAQEFATSEWADVATNGVQYLRNVKDGICTFEDALDCMRRDITYCREVSARARKVADAAAQATPEPVAQADDVDPLRAEITSAWNDLPDTLRCHPGLKRLHRALMKVPSAPSPVALQDDDACQAEPSDWVPPSDHDGDGSVAGMAARAACALVALQGRDDENLVAMAWNTVRAEARTLIGPTGLSGLLAAVEQYGDRRAWQAARASLPAPHVGETRFEGWLSEHAISDVGGSKLPMYHKQDMRDAYWAGFSERSASLPAINYTPGNWHEVKTPDELEAFFHSRLPAIRESAKEHGYAIGLHGSMRRDLDLIAVAWRDGASEKNALAHAVAQAACGITRDGDYDWETKPKGRTATSIPICWPTWHGVAGLGHIDLSLMVPDSYTDLLEAVDSVLNEAPCECPHHMRFDRGEHRSGCFLFDLNDVRTELLATPQPSETQGRRQMTEAEERQAAIGESIERAASQLPDCYNLEVCVERGAAWVTLTCPEAENIAPTFDGDHTLAEQVDGCIEAAIRHAIPASPQDGGQQA